VVPVTLVKIVYVADAQRRGPDLERIGRIEDIHPDVARRMVDEGTAVLPSPEELAVEQARVAVEVAGPTGAPGEGVPGVEPPKRPRRIVSETSEPEPATT
jgi:hypothetical protein